DQPMMKVLSNLLSMVSRDEFASICITSWEIWENRNSTLHGVKQREPDVLVAWAETLLSEFMGSLSALNSHDTSHFNMPCYDWIAPPPGQLKLNSGVVMHDGAWLWVWVLQSRMTRGK
ncbi:hypothetical protein Ddye_001798, partial [Dipteronia dyeriana]